MRTTLPLALAALLLWPSLSACSDAGSSAPADLAGTGGKAAGGQAGTGAGASAGATPSAGAGGSNGGGSGPVVVTGGSSGAPTGSSCSAGSGEDRDKDGWSIAQGDLNDCDANVNPGAIDVVNFVKDAEGKDTKVPLPDDQQVDEDCDGKATLPTDKTSCDDGFAVNDTDPLHAARALGLCRKVDEASKKWGVIEAAYNRISGGFLSTPMKPGKSTGLTDNLGTATKPKEGKRMLALSTGEARVKGQTGYSGAICEQSEKQSQTDVFPPGFPKEGSCGSTGQPFDGVALDLKIRVPSNARSMSFHFRFFTCEFPEYVCDSYNDVFAAIMSPNPLPAAHNMFDPKSGTANIAFEKVSTDEGDVIGVNNQSFLTACKQGVKGYSKCKGGGALAGSGFEGHAGSAWLQSQVPVPPGGIIYLRFAIWDSSDGALDSSVVIDNLRWSAEGGTEVTTTIDDEIIE